MPPNLVAEPSRWEHVQGATERRGKHSIGQECKNNAGGPARARSKPNNTQLEPSVSIANPSPRRIGTSSVVGHVSSSEKHATQILQLLLSFVICHRCRIIGPPSDKLRCCLGVTEPGYRRPPNPCCSRQDRIGHLPINYAAE